MTAAIFTAAILLVIGAGIVGALVGHDLNKQMRTMTGLRARVRLGLAAIAFGYGGLGLLTAVAYFAARGVMEVAR